jgi:hypothetical protein
MRVHGVSHANSHSLEHHPGDFFCPPRPPISAALIAKTDYCALVPEFDAALSEDSDSLRGKFQAQLSKPL